MEQENYDIVFLGDSLIKRGDFQGMFPSLHVLNFGKDGDTTNDLLFRIRYDLHIKETRCLVMLIGMNNLDSAMEDYQTLINEIKERFPSSPLVLCSITPTRGGYYLLNEKIDELNRQIEYLASTNNLLYADINSPLLEYGGGIKDEYCLDGIHLSSDGYDKIQTVLTPIINKVLNLK